MRNGLRRWLLAGVVASLSCTLLADIEKTVAVSVGADGGKVTSKAVSVASGSRWHFNGNAVPDWITSVVVRGKTLPSGSAAVHCFWAEKDGSVTRYTLEAEIISPARKYYRLVGFDVEVVTKSGKVKSVTPYFNPLVE